ncbi:MAG: hypothetical protein H7A31_04545 [Thermotogae bacterium]|nr:hypothetical protein [Thermotogota bacterium]MCP5465947.1 hypothetical protein [Thermotogota bacterium]HOO74480.1 VWA-like domain-containing protein [Tepiditoga sp.]
MTNIMEDAWIDLSKENYFFNYFRLFCEMIPSETVKTIKSTFTSKGQIRIIYNDKVLSLKGVRFTKALLKHQIYHIVFGHPFIKLKDKRGKGLMNLCMDAAINQYIRELDAFAQPLDVMIKEGHDVDNNVFFVTAPINMLNRTAEEYYDYALKVLEDNKMIDIEEFNSNENFESHDFESELSYEMTFNIVSEIVTMSHDKSKNNLPDGLEQNIKTVINKPMLSWKTLLRTFFGSGIRTDKYRTPLKPNRRYDFQPGWQSESGPNIVVLLDTSGSIIDEEYGQFFGEIESICKNLGGNVKIIQSDNAVQSITEYKRGKWSDIVIKGKGSSDLQPAIDYIEKNLRPEGIILFTDGWLEVPNIRRKSLFVLSKNYNKDFYSQAVSYYGNKSVALLN